MCQAQEQSWLGQPPWRSYRWFLPGLSLCSGERKGHFEVSPLLQRRVPPCLIQGGSHREERAASEWLVGGVGAGEGLGGPGCQLGTVLMSEE